MFFCYWQDKTTIPNKFFIANTIFQSLKHLLKANFNSPCYFKLVYSFEIFRVFMPIIWILMDPLNLIFTIIIDESLLRLIILLEIPSYKRMKMLIFNCLRHYQLVYNIEILISNGWLFCILDDIHPYWSMMYYKRSLIQS